MNIKPLFKLLLLGALLCSCSDRHVTAYTEYLSHQDLASYYVGTPDPALRNPPFGQRLIVRWDIPSDYLICDDLHLHIRILYHNSEELCEKLPITETRGTYIHSLLNECYCEKEGILSYQIDLIGDNVILERWHHQLWVELITFPE